ncbi:Fmu (Sun) domain protein [Desulforamulus reducens MI-1]|uniref:Fmu (Sun) domain protein n=1 Tax=Desulforamulus reducens (strain ATCC BAA-1160 / DSM 100696 / MI-1) TaxID=349161 RepID=A4J9G7_DESRM|nr:Fmu (Sun) domain protein [Desulforamulus reducens MI-1]
MKGIEEMKLPAAFLSKMEQLVGADYPQFLRSYEGSRLAGLRANGLKISPSDLNELLSFLEEPIAWSKDGFYYNEATTRPAKHPYYYAGLYYIQEPSAMLPAELLGAQPGERVLDLCAAPGGKSLQLAAHLGRKGLLVTNDLHPQRARVLLKNIERYGVANAIVLNETPSHLAKVFAGFFDRILVDAPCSGEGMFRKEPDMAKEWSPEEVNKYARWQQEILEAVPSLLRPGGEVVYSTCTFSPEENEQQMQSFVAKYPDFELVELRRLWPHQVKGEGHFVAKLKNKTLFDQQEYPIHRKNKKVKIKKQSTPSLSESTKQALADFSMQVWRNKKGWQEWLPLGGQVIERDGHILWESLDLPVLRGLKVLRSGWLLGTVERGRFRPSPAFALGLPMGAVKSAVQKLVLSAKSQRENSLVLRYLRGETIQQEGKTWEKGWHLVCLDEFPLGWAKGDGNWLKNGFPPGWRWIDGE